MLTFLFYVFVLMLIVNIIITSHSFSVARKQKEEWEKSKSIIDTNIMSLIKTAFEYEQALSKANSRLQSVYVTEESIKARQDFMKEQNAEFKKKLDDITCFAEDVKSEFLKNRKYRQVIEQRSREKISKKRKRPKRRKSAA